MKYQKFAAFGCTIISIRKFEFGAKSLFFFQLGLLATLFKEFFEEHFGIYNLHPIKCDAFILGKWPKKRKTKEIRGYIVGPVIYEKFDFTLF